MITWWWLSFCDETRPDGSRFVGAVVVQGASFIDAVSRSWALGVNPGGQVAGWELPEARLEPPAELQRLQTDQMLLDELSERWVAAENAERS